MDTKILLKKALQLRPAERLQLIDKIPEIIKSYPQSDVEELIEKIKTNEI